MEKYETVAADLKSNAKKEFADMTDDDFIILMDKQTKEDLLLIREYLVHSRDFFKRILLEEYHKTNPNSYRYKNAEGQVNKLNNKGKLLKVIIDKK